jgi:hypothetical protein
MFERLRPYVPPKLWRHGYHAYTLSQYLKHDRFVDLRRNRELRGKFAGQRGFVIGNGTSLNRMNLRHLANERVFTVNRFFRHAPEVRPACHLFMDPAYFGPLEADLEAFAATRDPSTICFAPLEYRDVMRKHLPDSHFLFNSGDMEVNRSFDVSGPIAWVQTVTLSALIVALHMGCSPIYLIGCDMDFLNCVQSTNPLRVVVRHFYDENKVEVVESGYDYPGYIQAVWRMFDGYRQVKEYLAGDRPIFNAGVGGYLDVFPRVDFESLFRS